MSDARGRAKRSAPAALRNREPIAQVLDEELPQAGLVLEIASGTGEHVTYFARTFPALDWQPSDVDPGALGSIGAWRAEALALGGARNVRPPMILDACSEDWPNLPPLAAILSINLVHISAREAAEGLVSNAGRLLPAAAPLILYGPYLEDGTPAAPSNLAFDANLRGRDPRWGLRQVSWLDKLAGQHGMSRSRRVEMPANNIMLVYRRNC